MSTNHDRLVSFYLLARSVAQQVSHASVLASIAGNDVTTKQKMRETVSECKVAFKEFLCEAEKILAESQEEDSLPQARPLGGRKCGTESDEV